MSIELALRRLRNIARTQLMANPLLIAIDDLENTVRKFMETKETKRENSIAFKALYEACAEFVRKCEAGEARSRRSYAQMKAAIKLADAEEK